MKHVVVRYRVKADRLAEHEALLAAVFEQLKTETPPGIVYEVIKLADGLSFIHQAAITGPGNPLIALRAFKTFAAEIGDRCTDAPVSSEGALVGSYG